MAIANRVRDDLQRFFDGDVWFSFKTSKITVVAAFIFALLTVLAVLAPWITPQNPYDPAQLDILDSFIPPVWTADGDARFVLGTDDQGRDMYSVLLYGARLSIGVGLASVLLSMVIGVALGLLSGFKGGATDALIMRIVDVQLSFPSILIALLLNGIMVSVFKDAKNSDVAIYVTIFSIAMSIWPQVARTVRGSTFVEKNKEYVQAARVIGLSASAIMWRHVLPNVIGPVLVISTINLAIAVIIEATLSFLGVGVPLTEPSLGTLIRNGNDFMSSGEWWIANFPGAVLAALALSVNLFGDWLRDALNPKLR